MANYCRAVIKSLRGTTSIGGTWIFIRNFDCFEITYFTTKVTFRKWLSMVFNECHEVKTLGFTEGFSKIQPQVMTVNWKFQRLKLMPEWMRQGEVGLLAVANSLVAAKKVSRFPTLSSSDSKIPRSRS
jgi:hypothetical protein